MKGLISELLEKDIVFRFGAKLEYNPEDQGHTFTPKLKAFVNVL